MNFDLPFQLSNRDAVDWLRSFPDKFFDLLITDPAYESLEKHRKVGTTTRLKHSQSSSNDWFEIFPNRRFPELFVELYRVLKDDSHLYMFCDQETMFLAKPLGEEVGFKFWKPIVFDKVHIGMGYHYRCRYELILAFRKEQYWFDPRRRFILFYEKGKRRLNDLSMPDILVYPRVRGGLPTEKPVGLIKDLVSQSSQPGALIADPFMGSASTGHAALELGRFFYGNDLKTERIQQAQRRLLNVIDVTKEDG